MYFTVEYTVHIFCQQRHIAMSLAGLLLQMIDEDKEYRIREGMLSVFKNTEKEKGNGDN